jgi:hypothetical protein
MTAPPSFSKPTPNISKFAAFFSKYFQRLLWRFYGKSRACKAKKEISLCSKFLRRSPVRKPRPTRAGKAGMAESNNEKHSMIFVFQKCNVGIENSSVFMAPARLSDSHIEVRYLPGSFRLIHARRQGRARFTARAP